MEVHQAILTLSLLLLIVTSAMSQSATTIMGARAAGLGSSSSMLADEWAVLNNVGGLAGLRDIHTAFTIEKKPALPGSSRMAAAFTTPFKVGTMGAGIFKFGDDLYSEQIITVGYANQFGIASLGMKLNYIQYRAEGYGTKRALSLGVGGIAEITSNLSVGAFIQNLNQPELTDDERLPTRLAAGLSFKPVHQVLFITEIEKDIGYDPIVKAGMEYCIHEKVFARTGFNINPEAAFFGIGFKSWRLKFDYAMQYNTALNFGHQASACYRIERPPKNQPNNK